MAGFQILTSYVYRVLLQYHNTPQPKTIWLPDSRHSLHPWQVICSGMAAQMPWTRQTVHWKLLNNAITPRHTLYQKLEWAPNQYRTLKQSCGMHMELLHHQVSIDSTTSRHKGGHISQKQMIHAPQNARFCSLSPDPRTAQASSRASSSYPMSPVTERERESPLNT